jgi:hypothetical protein
MYLLAAKKVREREETLHTRTLSPSRDTRHPIFVPERSLISDYYYHQIMSSFASTLFFQNYQHMPWQGILHYTFTFILLLLHPSTRQSNPIGRSYVPHTHSGTSISGLLTPNLTALA